MKGDFILNLFLILIVSTIISISFSDYISTKQDLGFAKLTSAANKSSDAALKITLGSNSISNTKKDVDLKLVKNTFFDVFCRNYKIESTDANLSYLYQNIPIIFLVVDDGIYVAKSDVYEASSEKKWDMIWSPKISFTHTEGDYIYNLSLSDKEDIVAINKVSGEKSHNIKPTLNKAEKIKIINNRIQEIVNENINASPVLNSKLYFNLAVSEDLTTNPIKSESFIVVIDNFNLSTPKPISKFSVASTELVDIRNIVGFEKDGKKYYICENKLPDSEEITGKFNSMEEAAKQGYMPYD